MVWTRPLTHVGKEGRQNGKGLVGRNRCEKQSDPEKGDQGSTPDWVALDSLSDFPGSL